MKGLFCAFHVAFWYYKKKYLHFIHFLVILYLDLIIRHNSSDEGLLIVLSVHELSYLKTEVQFNLQ